MEKILLAAQPRTQLGKKVKELRTQGFIPAVLYGKGKKPKNLQIENKKFRDIYTKAGTSSLIDLETDGEESIKVLIQDIQEDPITNQPIHIDFYAIRLDEKLTTEIPLKFVGKSQAVTELEGNLVKNYDEIEVECLPADLVPEIEVDISSLKTFDNQIKIKDLKLPEKIKILEESEEVVALVAPPRSEEELEAMEKETTADKEKEVVEDIEKKAEEEKAQKEAEKEGKEKKEEKAAPTEKAPIKVEKEVKK